IRLDCRGPSIDRRPGANWPGKERGEASHAQAHWRPSTKRGDHMISSKRSDSFWRSAVLGVTAALLLAWAPPTHARVTRIVIDTRVSPAFNGQSYGAAGRYETIAGRAFGELDPDDPHNAIIQDIELAPKNGNGHVEYVASFFLVKPIDMSKSSRLM